MIFPVEIGETGSDFPVCVSLPIERINKLFTSEDKRNIFLVLLLLAYVCDGRLQATLLLQSSATIRNLAL